MKQMAAANSLKMTNCHSMTTVFYRMPLRQWATWQSDDDREQAGLPGGLFNSQLSRNRQIESYSAPAQCHVVVHDLEVRVDVRNLRRNCHHR